MKTPWAQICYAAMGVCAAIAARRLFEIGAVEAWAVVAALALWLLARRLESKAQQRASEFAATWGGVSLGSEGKPIVNDPLDDGAEEVVDVKLYRHPPSPPSKT